MTDSEKLALIAPVVHAARRAWRFVHATGRLLPEWGECQPDDKNETFEMVRGREIRTGSPEHEFVAAVAAECYRSLFPAQKVEWVNPVPVPVASVAEWAESVAAPPLTMTVGGVEVEPSTLQPPPRRGRR